MPDVTCVRCRVKLRVADRVLGKTIKCPECGTSFVVAAPAQAIQPPAARKPAPPVAEIVDIGAEYLVPDPPKPKPKQPAQEDYEVVESLPPPPPPPPRRPAPVDEVELFDDEPAEEIDPQQAQQRKRVAEMKRAKLGVFLNFIAACILVGALGLTYFFILLGVSGAHIDNDLYALAGLPGIGAWVTAAVGLGFLVAGPNRHGSRGLAIATAAVAGLHLILMLVDVFQDHTSIIGMVSSGRSSTHWMGLVSELPYLCFLTLGATLPVSFSVDTIALFTGLLEVAQVILFLLLLRALGQTVKDYGLVGNSLMILIVFASALGVHLILSMIWGLILKNVTSASAGKALLILSLSLVYLTWIGLWVWQLILFNGARHSIGPRREGDGPKPRRPR
jgi:hypothetical protein